jgi:hypothetical protein
MFSRSLGGGAPEFAMTCRGTMVNPAAAAAASFRKVRRLVPAGSVGRLRRIRHR